MKKRTILAGVVAFATLLIAGFAWVTHTDGEPVPLRVLGVDPGEPLGPTYEAAPELQAPAKPQAPPAPVAVVRGNGDSLIGSQGDRLRYCYDVARAGSPDLTASLSISLVVEPNGRASSVEVDPRDALGTDELVTCVRRQLKGTRFPRAQARRVVEGYSLVMAAI